MSSDSTTPSQQDALMQLMSPDGYYTYLGIEKIPVDANSTDDSTTNPLNSSSSSSQQQQAQPQFTIDPDAVKKAYRKLSRRHHPDKGGDPNAFRLLNRAQKVLLHPKLRAQYDNLGIDLDEDAPAEESATESSDNEAAGSGISQGIVSELASLALTGIIQFAIRTMLMGAVAIFVVRYRLLLYPALLFLSYAVLSVVGKASVLRGGSVYETAGGVRMVDALSPVLIMVGLWLMSYGRSPETTNDDGDVMQAAQEWSWVFWVGESMVIALFTYNSITSIPWNIITLGALAVGGGLMALWFRGNFFNYLMVRIYGKMNRWSDG